MLGTPGQVKPMAVLSSPDAKRLYVSTGRGKRVFIIDTATNTVLNSVEVGQRPWGIALSLDGKTLYSANGPSNDVSVVDLATASVNKNPCRQRPVGRRRSRALTGLTCADIIVLARRNCGCWFTASSDDQFRYDGWRL